ncbi:MAG: hypothetical protein DRG25_05085 [Deltaproteobacteria bacterium]|nr:MAG: hypothetical protein DRG25_05085 [Deltaproteobacteria bacterium]
MARKHIKYQGGFEAEKFPYKSLRGFLGDMEERKELAHIIEEIDTRYEVGAIARKVGMSFERGPGIYYHNLKEFSDWTLVTNVINTYSRLFRALGTTKEKVFDDFTEKAEKITSSNQDSYYEIVKDGDFEQIDLRDNDIDITRLPIPLWSESDGGRYITTGLTMCLNPETGRQNMSITRLMVQGPRQTGILITPAQDIGKNYLAHKKKKKNMALAIAIGADPLMYIVSQINAPRDISEFSYWGAIAGEKAQMVKCKMSDLLVPKRAEIVLEGEVPIDEFHSEGPFGEFPGFYSGIRKLNVFKIHRLAMKEDAIYQGMAIGKDPNEANFITSWGTDLSVMKHARRYFSEITAVRSISAVGLTTVVAIDHNKAYPGLSKQAGHFIWACPQLAKAAKNIIVVDDTVDIYSEYDILWALGSYVQGNKDISIVEGTPGVIIDPSEPWGMGYIEEDKTLQTTTTTIIDATPKYGIFSEGYKRGIVDSPKEIKRKVEEKWSHWGIDKYFV